MDSLLTGQRRTTLEPRISLPDRSIETHTAAGGSRDERRELKQDVVAPGGATSLLFRGANRQFAGATVVVLVSDVTVTVVVVSDVVSVVVSARR